MMLEPVLVLPATLQRRVLASVVNDYQPFQCGMAIISKLDESLSMGEVLSTVIDGPMKIAYVTDGISVADDLHQPKANELIRFAKHLGEQVDSDKAHRYAGSNDVRAGKAFEMLNSM